MVRVKILKWCVIVTSMFMALLVNATTSVQVSVDRNPVMVNESFVLEIVADDSLSGSDLDLSPLLRTGLIQGRTNTSSQTQIINGNISRTTTWSVVLLARKPGEYRIPSLTVDGVDSKPLTVKVIKSNKKDGDTNAPIFIKNTLSANQVFLQQSLQLTTKLYLSPDVNLQSGTLSDPALDGANIQQQGKDKNGSDIVNGQRYRVIERNYIVTPQASGEFDLLSPTFNGEVSTGRRSAFSAFANTKPVSTIGNDLKLKVLPIPTDYQGDWLPSELVQLNDELQPKQTQFEVGEPITRTFTLSALNVNEEQLPTVTGTYPASFKVYPDKSETFSDIRNYGMVSQRVNSEAIVATEPGTFELPAVSLTWFNTVTKKVEQATIPSQTIVIVAGQSQLADEQAISNLQQGLTVESSTQCPEVEQPVQECPAGTDNDSTNSLVMWLGWILWFITLAWAIWLIQTNQREKTVIAEEQKPVFNTKKLKQACQQNDASAIRSELVLWAEDKFKVPVRHLIDVKSLVDAQLATQIDLLNKSLYSGNSSDFNAMDLFKAFMAQSTTINKSNKSDLPPLN